MKYQENPTSGIGDTGKNVLCSPSKVPLIIDRSQPDLTSFVSHG